ncbi:hypothetical protein BJX65DRAFT_307084 [Aspergillus insuetus]
MNYNNEVYCVLCSAALDTEWIQIGLDSCSALQRRRGRVSRGRQVKQRGEPLEESSSEEEEGNEEWSEERFRYDPGLVSMTSVSWLEKIGVLGLNKSVSGLRRAFLSGDAGYGSSGGASCGYVIASQGDDENFLGSADSRKFPASSPESSWSRACDQLYDFYEPYVPMFPPIKATDNEACAIVERAQAPHIHPFQHLPQPDSEWQAQSDLLTSTQWVRSWAETRQPAIFVTFFFVADNNKHRLLAGLSLAFSGAERRPFGTIIQPDPGQHPQAVKFEVQTYYFGRDDWITAIEVFMKKINRDVEEEEEDDADVQDLPGNGSGGICALVGLKKLYDLFSHPSNKNRILQFAANLPTRPEYRLADKTGGTVMRSHVIRIPQFSRAFGISGENGTFIVIEVDYGAPEEVHESVGVWDLGLIQARQRQPQTQENEHGVFQFTDELRAFLSQFQGPNQRWKPLVETWDFDALLPASAAHVQIDTSLFVPIVNSDGLVRRHDCALTDGFPTYEEPELFEDGWPLTGSDPVYRYGVLNPRFTLLPKPMRDWDALSCETGALGKPGYDLYASPEK